MLAPGLCNYSHDLTVDKDDLVKVLHDVHHWASLFKQEKIITTT
jgi:hypothetical protein